MPEERALYSFRPSVFALVNKNAFANLGPFNKVDTATGSSIRFVGRGIVLFAFVLAATFEAAALVSSSYCSLPLALAAAVFCFWASHHVFGAPIFWSVRKRLVYRITARDVVFERDGLRNVVPLSKIRSAFVIPTATMGVFGYHNVGAVYERKGRLHGFLLYGAPNRDLKKICLLLTRLKAKARTSGRRVHKEEISKNKLLLASVPWLQFRKMAAVPQKNLYSLG
jgi:hypothetical protein